MGARAAYAIEPLASAVLPRHATPGSPAELGRVLRCAAVHDTHAYLASSDGFVHHYTLARPDAGSDAADAGGDAPHAARWHAVHSVQVSTTGKPIERLVVFAPLELVAVLCGTSQTDPENTLRFYTYPQLAPAPPALAPIRGVQAIADGPDTGHDDDAALGFVSLCLLKRKKLVLLMLEARGWATVKEIAIARDAFIARRFDDRVCLATPSEYSLVHLDSGTQTPLGLPISQSTDVSSARVRPSIVPVDIDGLHAFLITSHSNAGTLGAFLRVDGEPTDKLLEWPAHPRAVVVEGPFVIALLRNDTIEVHDLHTLARVQQLSVAADTEPRHLFHIAASAALLPQRSGIDAARTTIEVGAPPVPPKHTDSDDADAAPLPLPAAAHTTHHRPVQTLLGAKRTLACLVRPTASSTAWQCMRAHDWAGASAALAADAAWDDEACIAATFLALEHMRATRFALALPLFVRARTDVRLVLDKYPRLRTLLRPTHVETYAALGDAWRAVPAVDEAIDASLRHTYGAALRDDKGVRMLRAQLVARAATMLATLLEAALERHAQPLYHAALLALCLDRAPNAPAATLQAHAAGAPVDVAERVLRQAHRYVLLAQTLGAHGRHAAALHLLRDVYDGQLSDRVDSASLDAIAEATEHLTHADDLIPAGLWLARHDTPRGLQVLRRVDYHGAASERVLRALRQLDACAAEELLEHIVFTSAAQVASQHAELCARLVQRAADGAERVPPYVPAHGTWPAHVAQHASVDGARSRIKLMVLLAHSQALDLGATLALLEPHDALAFERAIVLARMRRETEALRVVALDVRDAQSAESFCVEGHVLSLDATRKLADDAEIASYTRLVDRRTAKPERAHASRRLRTLLALYLDHGELDEASDHIRPAHLRLLNRHAEHFVLADVLPRLPTHWPVRDVQPFLLRTLRAHAHRRHLAEVVKSVALARSVALGEEHWQVVRYVSLLTQRTRWHCPRRRRRRRRRQRACRGRHADRRTAVGPGRGPRKGLHIASHVSCRPAHAGLDTRLARSSETRTCTSRACVPLPTYPHDSQCIAFPHRASAVRPAGRDVPVDHRDEPLRGGRRRAARVCRAAEAGAGRARPRL